MRELQPQLGWEMVHSELYQEARLEIIETQRPSPRQESTVTRKGFPRTGMTGSSLNATGISLKIKGHMVITHCPIQDKILVRNNTVMIGSPVGVITRENIVGAVPDLTTAHTVKQTIPVGTVPFSSLEKKVIPLLPHTITPIRANKLGKMLNDSGYDKNKTQFLADGFRQGFRIDCNISPAYRLSGNLQSEKQHPEIVSQKLKKETEANRIAGPFSCPPFPNFVRSPLGVCPKKKPGTFRLIQYLSFPEGRSVNDGISDYASAVQYTRLSHAIFQIKKFGCSSFWLSLTSNLPFVCCRFIQTIITC